MSVVKLRPADVSSATSPRLLPPALPQPEPNAGTLSAEKSVELAKGVRRLLFLERQIAELNREKSTVYQALECKKIAPGIVRRCMRVLRLEPEKRESLRERSALQDMYMRALQEYAVVDQDGVLIEGAAEASAEKAEA